MTVSNALLERCLDFLNSPAVNSNSDYSLQAFKALLNILSVVSGDNSLGHVSLYDLRCIKRVETAIIGVIQSASKPLFYSDSTTLEYMHALTSFIGQNTEAFMSPIGVEYLLNFSLNHHHTAGSGIG
jgi:hypothetical protein